MNTETFTAYLKDASRLYQLSYQELKSLVLEHPYCTNLHYLLLLKSKLENHRDFEVNLERAATYTFDRTFLYHLLRRSETGAPVTDSTFQLTEDYLELKDLSQLEKLPAQPAEEPEATPAARQDLNLTFDLVEEEADALNELLTESKIPLPPTDPPPTPAPKAFRPSRELVAAVADAVKVIHQIQWPAPAKSVDGPAPLPKRAFHSWSADSASAKRARLDELLKRRPNRPAREHRQMPPESPDLHQMARQSIAESEEIASETLAKLLEKQGLIDKAIDMYERLKLLFPEKSAYFAEQIKNLKKIA